MEAHQLSTKAARVGFDWQRIEDIFAKIQEELDELRAAILVHAESKAEADHARVREEVGDLLFAVTNIARHLQVEPEAAMKLTNRKFRRRFRYIEETLRARGQEFEATTLDELEALWQEAKAEKASKWPVARASRPCFGGGVPLAGQTISGIVQSLICTEFMIRSNVA